jgi:hypothetical protein
VEVVDGRQCPVHQGRRQAPRLLQVPLVVARGPVAHGRLP